MNVHSPVPEYSVPEWRQTMQDEALLGKQSRADLLVVADTPLSNRTNYVVTVDTPLSYRFYT